MIGFLTALREEREPLRKAWGLQPAGKLKGLELEVGEGCVHLCTGMGSERVLHASELLQRTFEPSLLVLVGFSVGLSTHARVGNILCDARSDSNLLAGLTETNCDLSVTEVATCGFLNTSREKGQFAQQNPDALIADLESESFLRALEGKMPALVVRVVSDELGTDLPLDFSKLADANGFPDVKAIAKAVAFRPLVLPAMLRLAQDAAAAGRALTDFLQATKPVLSRYQGQVVEC